MTGTKVGTALVLAGLVALAGFPFGGPPAVTSTFDDGAEGWTVVGDAQGATAEATHVAGGGSPGAHLRATDDVAGGTWYWNASPAYLGDKSAYVGGTLSFELNQSKTDDQFDNTDVVLESGETRLGYDFGDESTHPGTNWTAYEVPLSPDGWTNLETGEPVTGETFEAVLSDLDQLWIRGEYRSGSDTGGLDTVEMSG